MQTITFFLSLAVMVSANIIFSHVPLRCNITDSHLMYHGCLRGQECRENGGCIPMETIHYPMSFRPAARALHARQASVFSTDGKCGGNVVCDPNSKAYAGGCCSQYGWCGNTVDHCGTGCISGCTGTLPTSPATSPRSDGRCGKDFAGATCDAAGPYGGCCSQYGYCGSADDHCLPTNACQSGCKGAAIPAANIPRLDGRCGFGFNDAFCNPKGPYGGCCSNYGYCGSSTDHCLVGNGCQYGCTDGSPTKTLPSTTSQEPVLTPTPTQGSLGVTTDGTCNANTVCGNWPNGNCCSMYGFCGNTSAHCGAGCQSGNCLSAPVVAAPGPSPAPANPDGMGTFNVVGQAGVAAMHAALMPNGKVFFLDKLEDYAQLITSDGYYALSSEYDPDTNTAVPLGVTTNSFCSGGAFLADGRVVSLGGNAPLAWLDPNIKDGFTAIRYLERSSSDASLNGRSWFESPNIKLSSARWYATAQIMPDSSVFVASGSLNGLNPSNASNNNPTYEILNIDGTSRGQNIQLDILVKNQPYYMYPFVHLLNDGTLFIFVSKASQIFNVEVNTIVKELPDLPGDYRTYPNTGGSVLLPLTSANGWAPDIVICGGGAYQDISSPTDPSCGRIQPLSSNPQWEMDSMPEGRGMVEGTLLPNGMIIWMNGGNRGAQGFLLMSDPTLEALIYDPAKPLGQRWHTLASSSIPRLYHSVCTLLLDGTLLVAGSSPNEMPVLTARSTNPYATEYRVENYVPPYLQGANANKRPTNINIPGKTITANGSKFVISFNCVPSSQAVKIALYHGGYVTHSVHMGHRMLFLDSAGFVPGSTQQQLTVTGPPNRNVAPPGPYVMFVVVDGVPGMGQFVQAA